MFQKKELIVYKKDVCQIKDITEIDQKKYYILVPTNDNSLKIKVPVNNKFIRKIITKEEVKSFINSIPNILPLLEIEDKYIENEYKTLLQNGSHHDILTILKTAYIRNEHKKKLKRRINEKDIYYQELAENYLFNEFSIACNCTLEEIKNSIFKILKENVSE